MKTSVRFGAVSGNRGRVPGQGRSVENPPQVGERGQGRPRPGLVGQVAAGVRVEHPGRDRLEEPVRELDDEGVTGQPPAPADNRHDLVVGRVMRVADPHRR